MPRIVAVCGFFCCIAVFAFTIILGVSVFGDGPIDDSGFSNLLFLMLLSSSITGVAFFAVNVWSIAILLMAKSYGSFDVIRDAGSPMYFLLWSELQHELQDPAKDVDD
ncbi:hypothetical protein [Rhizobium sp. RU36D]|uniref:hypothetical protein n=1 Tax=Rhizobium sp. RU36D TaxID=1907415 RepID=UPI000A0698BC|nr:hypothetical protein [Rhizobium sp. RU36D]